MTEDASTAIEDFLDEAVDAKFALEEALPDGIEVVAVHPNPTSHDDVAIDVDAPGLEAQLEDAFDDLAVDVDASGTIYLPTEDDA